MDSGRTVKDGKVGILKLDKMRAQGSCSSDNRDAQELHAQAPERGPVSPQPSVDRLSVTWADPELSVSSASTKVNFFHMDEPTLPGADRFPSSVNNEEGSEDEYSASISAIMTRRESTRKSRKGRGRRPSSPFPSEGEIIPSYRRTSVLTTSSADSAASMEEGQGQMVAVTQEQIFESIRLHKEFISIVKQEHLSMRKKLKLVRQAKSYIKSNEGQLQERLAQSKNTRDIMAKCNILLAAKWQHMKREAANLSNIMIPWELRIKEIESHFGSVVASYFTFLRWLFWVNLVISFILVVFVIVPEMLTADVQLAGERKVIYEEDKNSSTNLLILWEFEGVFKCSPIFYGYYTNVDSGDYRLPLAYFMTGLAVYVYSFVASLKKMAENSRMSKLSEKEDECIFSWKLFTGWDFMIGNAETAHNRTASIILSFKEALLEEEEKKKDPRNWRIISLRILVNLCVIILLAVSAFAVVKVVERSNEKSNHWWRQNEITIVMSILSNLFPILFELLGMLEHYHPRKQLRIQLGRIMLLNLLNIYSLIIALFSKIDGMTTQLENLKPKPNSTLFNETQHLNFDINSFIENSTLLLKPLYENETHSCYGIATQGKICDMFLPLSTAVSNINKYPNSNNLEFSPAAFRKRSIYVGPEDSSVSNFKPKIDKTLFNKITPSPYSNENSWTIKAIKEPSEVENNSTLLQSTMLQTVTSTLSKTTPTMSSKLIQYKMYINSLAKNSTEADDIDENLDDDNDDYYNSVEGTVVIEDENVSKLDETNTESYEKTTNSEESTDYNNENITKNEFKISTPITESTALVDSKNVIISNTVNTSSSKNIYTESTTNNYNVKTINDYDFEETGEGANYSTIYVAFGESFSSTTAEISESHSTNAADTSEDSVSLASNGVSGVATNPIVDIRSTASTAITTGAIFTDSYNFSDISQNKYNTTHLGFNITTINKNFTSSKMSPCYEIKCIRKAFSMKKLNGTQTVLHSNYSGDLIIEDSHNHQRYNLSKRTKRQLLSLCWETMFGQELVKLTMMDMVLCIIGTLLVDFYRAVFVRYMNRCWCWDLEKKFPQYGDFKIAENILHLVNNQGMVWMGLFFSPGLAVLNLVKLVIMMYLRSWAVMTCNVPHEVVFRASRSNNFYLGLLLIMLFLCVLPVGYAIVWVRPSWHCGPFSDYDRIYHIFTSKLNTILPNKLKKISDYIASPGIVIPLLVLLILVIYYLTSLTNSLREANNDLKAQLRRERTEERRKMFQLADRRRRVGSAEMECTPFERWKKILPNLPPAKSIDSDERKETADGDSKVPIKKKGDIFAKIVSMALRRPVPEEKIPEVKMLETPTVDEETDTEFHESLPEDVLQSKNIKKIPHIETVKKRANVDFLTTNDGKIKEDIVNPILKHKVKTLLSKKIPTFDPRSQRSTSAVITEKSPADIERRAKIKFKTRDLVKAKILEESKRRADEDRAKAAFSVQRGEDVPRAVDKKFTMKQISESSTQSRQSDSIGSVIPVITISKTESDDDMLRESESSFERSESEVIINVPTSSQSKDDKPYCIGESSKPIKRVASNLKALRRQSSVDSINEQKCSKEKRVDEGHKFQYSL